MLKEQIILDAIALEGVAMSKHGARVSALYDLLRETCSHPTTYVRETYSPGSYYDREEWHKEEACNYCKCVVKDLGSTVGGYG